MCSRTCFLLSCLTMFSCILPAFASPPFVCVKAASSANGEFLAVTDLEMQPGSNYVKQTTMTVLKKTMLEGTREGFSVPSTYWADWPALKIAFGRSDGIGVCPLALITNDGKYLVLLKVGAVPDIALRIYAIGGVRVKDVGLKEVWPGKQLAVEPKIITDATPQWFAGGTFVFTSGNRALIHKTRFGNTVRITLETGAVSGSD